MAWDEDPERPGSKVITFAISPADRTPLENMGAALVGEEANPVAQIGLLVTLLLILTLLTRRKRPKAEETDIWDQVSTALAGDHQENRDDHISRKKPEGPPPGYLFESNSLGHPTQGPPPIPEEGLPEGWTTEQWSYYGQQWLDSQET